METSSPPPPPQHHSIAAASSGDHNGRRECSPPSNRPASPPPPLLQDADKHFAEVDQHSLEHHQQIGASSPTVVDGIPSKKRLYVSNLKWQISEDLLRSQFEKFGVVTEARVVRDRRSGWSRGFGFVSFDDDGAATEAMQALNGVNIEGRLVRIEHARSTGPLTRRGGGGGGGFAAAAGYAASEAASSGLGSAANTGNPQLLATRRRSGRSMTPSPASLHGMAPSGAYMGPPAMPPRSFGYALVPGPSLPGMYPPYHYMHSYYATPSMGCYDANGFVQHMPPPTRPDLYPSTMSGNGVVYGNGLEEWMLEEQLFVAEPNEDGGAEEDEREVEEEEEDAEYDEEGSESEVEEEDYVVEEAVREYQYPEEHVESANEPVERTVAFSDRGDGGESGTFEEATAPLYRLQRSGEEEMVAAGAAGLEGQRVEAAGERVAEEAP